MLNSRSCDYSDVYILVNWIILPANSAGAGAVTNNESKKCNIYKFYSIYWLHNNNAITMITIIMIIITITIIIVTQ